MAGNPIVLLTVTYKYQGKCARAVNKRVGDSAVSVGVTKPLLPTKKSPHEIGLRHLQINGEVQNWNKERQHASEGGNNRDSLFRFREPRFSRDVSASFCKAQNTFTPLQTAAQTYNSEVEMQVFKIYFWVLKWRYA